MPFVASNADGVQLFYRDYYPSVKAPAFSPDATRHDHQKPTLVFSAAWPFSSKMYDHLMLPLCESFGYRCIAIDRRGFGNSEWTSGVQSVPDADYDTLADDLGQIIEGCDAATEYGFVGIGASLGCGEFLLALKKKAKLLAACRGLVFLGPSLPIPMQTERKTTGPPREFWDSLLQRLRDDRVKEISNALSYVWGERGAQMMSPSEKVRYEAIAIETDPFAMERIVQIFLNRDFTDILLQEGGIYDFPILILHGNADAANPVKSGPGFIQANVPRANIIVYEDAAHGVAATHKQRCMNDMVKFVQAL